MRKNVLRHHCTIKTKKHQPSHPFCSHSLRGISLFREDTEDEVAFLVGLVGGGNDDILPRTQTETLGHLSQVNVSSGTGFRGVRHEELLLHVLLVSMHLTEKHNSSKKGNLIRHSHKGVYILSIKQH